MLLIIPIKSIAQCWNGWMNGLVTISSFGTSWNKRCRYWIWQRGQAAENWPKSLWSNSEITPPDSLQGMRIEEWFVGEVKRLPLAMLDAEPNHSPHGRQSASHFPRTHNFLFAPWLWISFGGINLKAQNCCSKSNCARIAYRIVIGWASRASISVYWSSMMYLY